MRNNTMTNSNGKTEFKTVVIRDAELHWARLDTPVDPFGAGPAWEIVVQTSDEAKANEWKGLGINVKSVNSDGGTVFKANLKRKAKNKSGKDNPAPQIIMADADAEFSDTKDIGNGSIGSVRCFQYDYNVGGRSGTATQFNAVKVTKLVKFEKGGDEIDF